MTSKQLRRQRAHRDCAAFFMALASNPNLRKRLPRMRALANASGYHADRPGNAKSHRKRSKAMQAFRARVDFYTERGRGWLNEHTFIYRPHFDEVTRKASGYYEWLDESTGKSWFFVPVKRRGPWKNSGANTSGAAAKRGAPTLNRAFGATTNDRSTATNATPRSTHSKNRAKRAAGATVPQ